jgi:peptide/nickel transport system substrate-binding protein
MPRPLIRRALTVALVAALAFVPGACRDRNEGVVRVTVIGAAPKIRDPAQAALSPADAALLASVGQGLVRFDAAGNIVAGLAERWNVSDDGMSYIFRIAATNWPGGGKVTAQQVARLLKRSLAASSRNPLKDTLGVVDDIVPMTDRVIEIRLRAPRPNLLALLAQPEFAIVRAGLGTGPFQARADGGSEGELRLTREVTAPDGDQSRRDELLLGASAAEPAVRAFAAAKVDLVLGGTFADLPYARAARLPRGALRFDPVSGLFGLVPAVAGSRVTSADARRLLNAAIDRPALIAAYNVPGLAARTTMLEPGLEGVPAPVQPPWFARSPALRRAALLAEANRLFGSEKPAIRVFLPAGPGSDLLFNRLALDWGALGFAVARATTPSAADFRLIDMVAPSTSAAWFLRQFRCGMVPVCDDGTDQLLDGARETLVPGQRYAMLAEAAARMDDAHVFLPLAAPVRWSLVSGRIIGFAGNRYGRHTLTDLDQRIAPGGS